jgi:hypothetical protein
MTDISLSDYVRLTRKALVSRKARTETWRKIFLSEIDVNGGPPPVAVKDFEADTFV